MENTTEIKIVCKDCVQYHRDFKKCALTDKFVPRKGTCDKSVRK